MKYLINFCRNLEMAGIDFEINPILTWPVKCFLGTGIVENQVPTFAIVDTKLYIWVVPLPT